MSRPTRITSQAVERNVQLQRQLDVQRQELSTFANENAKLLSAASAISKVEVRRRQMNQMACQSEQQYEDRIKQEDYQRRLQQRTMVQNQAIATELDKQTADEERRSREIQRICEESPELRELERALNIAFLNKERSAQHEEKISLALREQERIQAIEDQMEYDRVHAIRSDAEKIGAKKAMYETQRSILQKQISDRQEELREMQRLKEMDKQLVDDIVAKISAEDYADMIKRKSMQEATATMIRDFETQRRRELLAAKQAQKMEEDAILAYNQSIEARSEGVAAKKQAKKDEEDKVLQRIVEETERKRLEEEEFNNLRDMLWEEELEAKRSREVRERQEKQTQMKRDMMDANARMLVTKEDIRRQEAVNEARTVALMRQKFAEDEAKEREEEEQRRSTKLHHMTMIEKQKIHRKMLYDDERAQEIAAVDEAMRREEYRKQVIAEARKRLLQQHAEKLQGFLPPGVAMGSDERQLFQQTRK